MSHKLLVLTMAASATLMLAGCGAKNSSNSSTSSSSSLLAAKSSTKVSAKNAGPKQSVALITAYAGNKYGNDWATTAKSASKNGLTVNLYQSSNYKLSDGGQGVAYNVSVNGQSSNLVYTLKGNDVILYENANKNGAKKLGTVSRDEMANYLNQNGQGQFVEKLTDNAQIVDKTNGALNSSDSSNRSSTKGQYGNEGAFNLPDDMQGTWYSEDKYADNPTITISGNQIKTKSDSLSLYKKDKNFDADNAGQGVQDATKDWGSAASIEQDGLHWIDVRGWCQGAGDGTYYTVTTENVDGHQVTVLVVAGGAGIWTDAVYYQTPRLAHQYKNTKYDNLHYQDDDD